MPKAQKRPTPRQAAPGPTIGHLRDLTPDPANRRQHNPRNLGMLVDALQAVGASRSIVVDEDGVILAGNGVVEAASEAGITKLQIVEADGDTIVAVRRRGLTPVQKRQLAIYDNRTAELAEWNVEQLAADLQNGEDLTAFFLPNELKKLIGEGVKGGKTDADDVPAERVTDIQPGDLFELGAHRLLCGDSTKLENLERVVAAPWVLLVTSPPYNSGDGGYKTDYYGKTKRFYVGQTDDRTEAEWVAFCESVLNVAAQTMLDDASTVVFNVMYTARCRAGYGRLLFGQGHPFTVKETICWDKGHGFPTASRGILSRNWELVFVLSKGEKYRTTQTENEARWAKWDIARPPEQEGIHKAAFPIAVAERALVDFSDAAAVVYEPFSGSGTTILASERLGRCCYAVELEPRYCQVAIDRWEAYTAQKAVKVGEAVRV